MRSSHIRVLLAALLLPACQHKAQLQYDLGRATAQVIATQSDLSRPSVADSTCALQGAEAVEIYARATEQAAEKKSGEVEAVDRISVQ